jgi:endonuclease/exonuclease/phosphatase family metal-dependent hydrolase
MCQIKPFIVFYLLSVWVSNTTFAQSADKNRIAVAFYNCENFFDTTDNPAKDDEEFTPGGKYHYNTHIYRQKLHNIARVIKRMNTEKGPAIIGLAEVENSIVLDALIRQPEIAKIRYRYVWYDGPDPRGINVALMYDPARFSVLKSEPLHVDISATGGKSETRDVLHVSGVLAGDTVHIFVNHWPSRRGGEDESASKRAIAAKVNKAAADALFRKNRNSRIIIMGDLNDNPDDISITRVLGAIDNIRAATTASALYNPFAAIYKSGTGTEVYRKKWNLFDQIIVSGSLVQGKKLRYQSAEVYKPAFIQDTYKGHQGEPHRSFKGTYWINGYSDHFPVITYFTTNR